MTFRLASIGGRAALVDTEDNWYELTTLGGAVFDGDPMQALGQADALHELDARGFDRHRPGGNIGDSVLDPPVPRPRNCFAVGLNYRSHAAESGMELPATPLVFTKFPSCLSGHHHDIELNSSTADYEVELVVVIGRGGRDIPAEHAWDHVVGLTIGQDISDRALQFAATPPHFDLGKSRDTYGPIGPMVVSTDVFEDPNDVRLWCEINGERRQDDSTSDLVFDVAHLVSYLSGIMTLGTGDLIFTGTPSGVGASTRTFLQPGDVITSHIAGIGTLVNVCR